VFLEDGSVCVFVNTSMVVALLLENGFHAILPPIYSSTPLYANAPEELNHVTTSIQLDQPRKA